jgi:hypothetical protein
MNPGTHDYLLLRAAEPDPRYADDDDAPLTDKCETCLAEPETERELCGRMRRLCNVCARAFDEVGGNEDVTQPIEAETMAELVERGRA